ncbi:hypothetical protein ACFE04_027141 [Oxalis oulophora]
MEDTALSRLVDSDWYSPRRLLSSPTRYDFPGDRFIPNRSLMDIDQAHTLLTTKTNIQLPHSKFHANYRETLVKNLSLDSEGKPFRMLVFRGSPKSNRNSIRSIDEIRSIEEEEEEARIKGRNQYRTLQTVENKILDAPNIQNNFYLNIIDWGSQNVVAVALGLELYLWNAENAQIQGLPRDGLEPACVSWSNNARELAVGNFCSKLQLWDVETLKVVRSLEGHTRRIGTLSWNSHILTSGGKDKCIINHDVRASNSIISRLKAHREEICGLKWSNERNVLASGGNDNMIFIWDAFNMKSSNYLHRFSNHKGAVKALAWSPYQFNVLASGGGIQDGSIKIWNIQKGLCIDSLDTGAQICGLEWNRHHKELLSAHGYGSKERKNQLCLWKYPSMTKLAEIKRHESRVLHTCQSPDGLTVLSAGQDETIRFWDIFGPPMDKPRVSDLDGLLSLKTSPLR